LIIEKNTEICEDPRAIAMAGDTTRILEVLGVTQAQMTQISQSEIAAYF
jgi:2-polyprenyl-6-methoxyphenol hydroxylase-like FAD-dependent oxidoreductase